MMGIRKGWSFFLGGGEASIDDGVLVIISGDDVLMFNVTLKTLIFKCFAEGGGGGDGVGGGGINTLFQCIIFLLTPCF